MHNSRKEYLIQEHTLLKNNIYSIKLFKLDFSLNKKYYTLLFVKNLFHNRIKINQQLTYILDYAYLGNST